MSTFPAANLSVADQTTDMTSEQKFVCLALVGLIQAERCYNDDESIQTSIARLRRAWATSFGLERDGEQERLPKARSQEIYLSMQGEVKALATDYAVQAWLSDNNRRIRMLTKTQERVIRSLALERVALLLNPGLSFVSAVIEEAREERWGNEQGDRLMNALRPQRNNSEVIWGDDEPGTVDLPAPHVVELPPHDPQTREIKPRCGVTNGPYGAECSYEAKECPECQDAVQQPSKVVGPVFEDDSDRLARREKAITDHAKRGRDFLQTEWNKTSIPDRASFGGAKGARMAEWVRMANNAEAGIPARMIEAQYGHGNT